MASIVIKREKVMKNIILILFLVSIQILGQERKSEYFVIESQSTYDSIINDLREALKEKNIKIFSEIDHSYEAENVGLSLRPTKVLIVGNPKVGTLLMQENQDIALHLPLKILILEQGNKVKIYYNKIENIVKKDFPKNSLELPKKIDNIIIEILTSVINSNL